MAVDPDELLSKLINNDVSFINDMEVKIDKFLTAQFTGRAVGIHLNGADYFKAITPRILNELKVRYSKWDITFKSSFDQRDEGGNLEFTPKRVTPKSSEWYRTGLPPGM